MSHFISRYRLQWLYAIFITIIVLLAIFTFLALKPSPKKALLLDKRDILPPLPSFTEFHSFHEIYEPSAVHQLTDGRFIVVEDEMTHPLDILSLNADGNFSESALFLEASLEQDDFRELDDLEGVDVDNQGYIYAITSHSRTEKGEQKARREKFVRFKVEENRILEPIVVTTLKEHITNKFTFLKEAAEIKDVKDEGGFNIEGLAFNDNKEQLLIAFRSPLADGKAIIVTLENVKGLFEGGENPRFSDQMMLIDLNGEGIRDITYVPQLQGYLIISKSVASDSSFNLWFWKGTSDHLPQRVTAPGLKDFAQAEGITPVKWNKQRRLLIVSDDGNMEEGRSAHYLLLKYDQLLIN